MNGRLYCLDCAPVENRKDTVVSSVHEPDYEQIPDETLNSAGPIDAEKEPPDDVAGGYEDEKPKGKTLSQTWAKVRGALTKLFGK
jgi:hypothetical protein